jgi:3-hydroxyacyl-[acyl-carrier-protein] dehydratase
MRLVSLSDPPSHGPQQTPSRDLPPTPLPREVAVAMSDLLLTALQALPHGPEFRFLDRLLALVPGESGQGEYRMPNDAPFLRGHFPGQPLLPGVLLVEACAQLAGVVAQSDPRHTPLTDLRLTALRQIKLLGAVLPESTVHLEARIVARMGPLIQASVKAEVAGQGVLTGELTLSGAVHQA